MREFLKLIVSILVIGIITLTIYFFLQSSEQYKNNQHLSGDTYLNWEQNKLEINDKNEDIEKGNETKHEELFNSSGDFVIEIDENVSGDNESFEEKIARINLIETKNCLANLTKTIEDKAGLDIMGIKNKDFYDIFLEDGMDITVQVAGTMVYILPMPDLIDNAQYHYDENGHLVLYVCKLMGVGGEIRYYFENDSLLIQEQVIEDEIQIEFENIDDILERSKLIYSKYMK